MPLRQPATWRPCAKMDFGTGSVLRKYHPPGLVYLALAVMLVANTITAGADLGAIAAAVNFKWLALTLVAYIAVAFFVRANWSEVLSSTFVPRISFDEPLHRGARRTGPDFRVPASWRR